MSCIFCQLQAWSSKLYFAVCVPLCPAGSITFCQSEIPVGDSKAERRVRGLACIFLPVRTERGLRRAAVGVASGSSLRFSGTLLQVLGVLQSMSSSQRLVPVSWGFSRPLSFNHSRFALLLSALGHSCSFRSCQSVSSCDFSSPIPD